MPDIEREVRRLLREDNHAIDVKWEVIVENDKTDDSDAKVGNPVECSQCDVDARVFVFLQVIAQGETTRVAPARRKIPLDIPSLEDSVCKCALCLSFCINVLLLLLLF